MNKLDNFNEIYVDDKYDVSLMNRLFLTKKMFIHQKLIKQKSNVIKIRDIMTLCLN